jgi:gluconate 2-dehydrogenase subunit 3-like protein
MHGHRSPYTFDLDAMRETAKTTAPAMAAKPGKLPRRTLLEAAVGAALVVAGSAIAIARTGGYALPPGHKLTALAPWQFVVVEHAARRIAAPDREEASTPSADDLEVAAFVDGWMAHLPDRTRRDLGRFFAYVEHIAPIAAGFASRFTRLGPQDQDRVLASIERSSSDLLRAGFDGLRSLVFLGYYRDPRTWKVIGYDGPLVGRPQSGSQ